MRYGAWNGFKKHEIYSKTEENQLKPLMMHYPRPIWRCGRRKNVKIIYPKSVPCRRELFLHQNIATSSGFWLRDNLEYQTELSGN